MDVNEPWSNSVTRNHWYGRQLEFVREYMTGAGNCLVIGSPPAEANAIAEMGFSVTFFDIRTPPEGQYSYVPGDARSLPFDAESFDHVSSTCVLCHVGTGRYGDVPDAPGATRGDDIALGEIARVLKRDGRAVIQWGPCSLTAGETSYEPGALHRTYALPEMRALCVKHGLSILHSRIDEANYLSTVLLK